MTRENSRTETIFYLVYIIGTGPSILWHTTADPRIVQL